MQKAKLIEEVLKMKFDDVYSRFKKKKLSCKEASEILGVSLSSFYRKHQRFKNRLKKLL